MVEFTTRQNVAEGFAPIRLRRFNKNFIVFGVAQTENKKEVKRLQNKAKKSFKDVRLIDSTMEQRPGKNPPVKMTGIIVRNRKDTDKRPSGVIRRTGGSFMRRGGLLVEREPRSTTVHFIKRPNDSNKIKSVDVSSHKRKGKRISEHRRSKPRRN